MLYEQLFTTVLIVDDEPLLLPQLCDIVKTLGYTDVRPATTCRGALQVLGTARVGVLIADVGLPDGDGRRLALDALRLHPDLVLILISGFPAQALLLSPELRERAHLLEKPFDFHELAALLTRCRDDVCARAQP